MKLVITFILILLSSYAYSQKAYEFVYYEGTTKAFKIKLSLADGYLLGSQIIKTDLKSSTYTTYIVSEHKNRNLSFLPKDKTIPARKRDHITLYKLNDGQELPHQIKGFYGLDLKTFRFTLYPVQTNP